MALGSLLPYLSLYYQRNGLSGVQIGTLSALGVLISSPAAILWSGIADRLKVHRRMLLISVLAAPFCVWLLGRTTSFGLFIPITLAYGLAIAPIIPLLDGAALEAARVHGRSYGEIRVGGTIGWIVSVAGVGLLIQLYDIHWLFYSYIACMALMLLFATSQSRRTESLRAPWSANVRLLLSDPTVIIFLVSAFIVMVGNGAVQNFFSLYMDGIGASEGLIGAAWAVASVSEFPVMMLAGRLMRRIGTPGLLKLSFLTYAVRWLLLSFIHDPAWALGAQLLHGLSFAAFLTAGVTYLSERTPEGLATTAQSIFTVVCYGIAALLGSLIGGYLYDHSGMTVFFRVFSLTTFAGLVIFWLSSTRAWKAAFGTNAAPDP
jgi:PPP family 3-phenylpropionic acid transporter